MPLTLPRGPDTTDTASPEARTKRSRAGSSLPPSRSLRTPPRQRAARAPPPTATTNRERGLPDSTPESRSAVYARAAVPVAHPTSRASLRTPGSGSPSDQRPAAISCAKRAASEAEPICTGTARYRWPAVGGPGLAERGGELGELGRRVAEPDPVHGREAVVGIHGRHIARTADGRRSQRSMFAHKRHGAGPGRYRVDRFRECPRSPADRVARTPGPARRLQGVEMTNRAADRSLHRWPSLPNLLTAPAFQTLGDGVRCGERILQGPSGARRLPAVPQLRWFWGESRHQSGATSGWGGQRAPRRPVGRAWRWRRW
jgi:hypothetical protein